MTCPFISQCNVTARKSNVFKFCDSTYVQGTLKGVSGRKQLNFDLGGCIQGAFSISAWSKFSCNLERNYPMIAWQEVLIDIKHASYSSAGLMNLAIDSQKKGTFTVQQQLNIGHLPDDQLIGPDGIAPVST